MTYGQDTITLNGIKANQLTAADFKFAAPMAAGLSFNGTSFWAEQ